ncbi:MAG: hypothetical protein JSU66_05090 [Deltaproteobacteria bacterium]|nr:MAG: hypothetical protein JSU66_05090 [Deltaproteobacteria bacterium]
MKLIVAAAISFALYSGYCFLPAYTTQSQFEHLVSALLADGTHKLTDKSIRNKTLEAARSDALPLEKDDIEIWREQVDGERTIHVEFALPVTISYLGSERTLVRNLHLSHTYEVDEAAEARLVAQRDEERRMARERKREGRARAADYYGRIKDECEKGTSRDFVVTHVMVTGANGKIKTVDCPTAYRRSEEFGDR